jgi:hypothetical protein
MKMEMKSFQVRLSSDVYDVVKEMAEERNTSIADIIRDSLEARAIAAAYVREGKRLYWEDPRTKERVEILIPGLSMRAIRRRRAV